MALTPNIEKILSALKEYPWTNGGPTKEENGVRKYDTISMLLLRAGVSEKEIPTLLMATTWWRYGGMLRQEYGLRDNVDYYLILIAGDSSSSQEDMLNRVAAVLKGNLNAIAPSYRDWITSLVEKRDLPTPPREMRPRLNKRQIVEVLAGITWQPTMQYRVYSCPDTSDYKYISGATALILINRNNGARIPLEVSAVIKLAENGELENADEILQPLRRRARKYLAEVKNDTRIIQPGCAHRLYILSTEPWPDKMQRQTTPASTPPTEWAAILSILTDPEQFFQWPQLGALLWKDCVRTQNDGEHIYPAELVTYLEQLGIKSDTRTNGPAIVSFLAAGGKRPSWGNEGWPIHHVFKGTDDGNLFTHSAGLVAAHPIAHHLAHQSALLKWLLCREAFLRFGFDPNGDFVVP